MACSTCFYYAPCVLFYYASLPGCSTVLCGPASVWGAISAGPHLLPKQVACSCPFVPGGSVQAGRLQPACPYGGGRGACFVRGSVVCGTQAAGSPLWGVCERGRILTIMGTFLGAAPHPLAGPTPHPPRHNNTNAPTYGVSDTLYYACAYAIPVPTFPSGSHTHACCCPAAAAFPCARATADTRGGMYSIAGGVFRSVFKMCRAPVLILVSGPSVRCCCGVCSKPAPPPPLWQLHGGCGRPPALRGALGSQRAWLVISCVWSSANHCLLLIQPHCNQPAAQAWEGSTSWGLCRCRAGQRERERGGAGRRPASSASASAQHSHIRPSRVRPLLCTYIYAGPPI